MFPTYSIPILSLKNENQKNVGITLYRSGSGMPTIVTSPMDSKPCRPCSIRCQGVSGLIPTLQCRLCLCLYHTECVGLGSHSGITQGYVCKVHVKNKKP